MTPSFSLKFTNLVVEQVRARQYEVEGASVTLEPRRFVTADSLTVSAVITPLIKGEIGLRVAAEAYKGTVNTIFIFPLTDTDAPVKLLPKWENIDLQSLKSDYPGISLQYGTSSGKGDLLWDPASTEGYKGTLNIQFTDLVYLVPEKMAGALDLQVIRSADGIIKLDGPKIEIDTLGILGDSADMHLQGVIYRDYRPEKSRLELEVRLHPHKEGESRSENEYIPFTITGTAEKPDVEFLGVNLNDLFKEQFDVFGF